MFRLIIDERWQADLTAPVELAIPLRFGGPQPNAFGLPRATADPAVTLRDGGPVNCVTVTLNPHGNGTHTECANHVSDDAEPVYVAAGPGLVPACLITVSPVDGVVERADIEASWAAIPQLFRQAVVLRTGETDPYVDYTGTHPAYLSEDAMRALRDAQVEHLLLELPSVDPEDDGGAVAAHKIFWDVPAAPRRATITEMIRVPADVEDGLYVLALNVPRFHLDAAPSRPVIWPVWPVG